MLKRLLNDSNICVVNCTLKLIGVISSGLWRNFNQGAKSLFNFIIQKLKDKKSHN